MTQDIIPAVEDVQDDYSSVIPEDLQLQKYDAKDAEAVTKTGDWLPRLQVFGSNTTLVKEGKATMGVFALVYTQEKFLELGKEVPFLSLTFRTKALRIPTDGSAPISYYNRMSDQFKKVVSDSSAPNSGCMFGPEFMIWLPNPGCFASYFFGNPTLRRVAPALLSLMKIGDGPDGKAIYKPKPALTKIHFIKGQKFSWHGALIQPYSTPLPPPSEEFELTLREEVQKFLNPPESQVEKVEQAQDAGRVR